MALRTITFSNYKEPSAPLFKQLNVPTIHEIIFKSNIILAHKTLNKIIPKAIQQTLNFRNISNSRTRNASMKLIIRPRVKTTKYGINSIKYQTILNWNELQSNNSEIDLQSTMLSKVIKLIKS